MTTDQRPVANVSPGVSSSPSRHFRGIGFGISGPRANVGWWLSLYVGIAVSQLFLSLFISQAFLYPLALAVVPVIILVVAVMPRRSYP